MSKNEIFYIGRGCSRDHLGPHKTQKWSEKRAENLPKTAQDRPKFGSRLEAGTNITLEFMGRLLQHFKEQKQLHKQY